MIKITNQIDTSEICELFSKYKQKIIDEFISMFYLTHNHYSSPNPHVILYLSSDWNGGNIPMLWINSLEEFWDKWNRYKELLIFK